MKKILCLLLAITVMGLWGCSEQPKKEETPSQITFSEQVVLEQDSCRFTVTDIQEDPLMGCTMAVKAENLSDLALNFSIDRAALNGCMVSAMYSQILAPGEILENEICFPAEDLGGYGIDTVTVVEFKLNVYDEDTYDTVTVNQPVKLFPRGEAAAQYSKRESQNTDIVLMDNEYCTVVVTGKNAESFWGYDLYVDVQNKSDKTLMLSTQEAALNEVFCDPFWTVTVAPGMRSCSTMYWFSDDLESAGVTKIDTVTLLLSVADLDNWHDPMIQEEITFAP